MSVIVPEFEWGSMEVLPPDAIPPRCDVPCDPGRRIAATIAIWTVSYGHRVRSVDPLTGIGRTADAIMVSVDEWGMDQFGCLIEIPFTSFSFPHPLYLYRRGYVNPPFVGDAAMLADAETDLLGRGLPSPGQISSWWQIDAYLDQVSKLLVQ